MGVRITWRDFGDDEDVLYWFSEEPVRGGRVEDLLSTWTYSALGYSTERVRSQPVDPPGTDDEVGEWSRAARAYLDEVVAATDGLEQARKRWSRRRWWPVRWWVKRYHREARAFWQQRVVAAAAAYQPVRQEVDRRLDEQAAIRAEEAERERLEFARRWQESESRFQRWLLAWRCRQAMLDRVLADGKTPRQWAAEDRTPRNWPAELEAAVGDVDAWWAGVRAAARSERARVDAVRTIVEAVTATAAALERAGRPDVNSQYRAGRQVHGWPLEFTWPTLPKAPVLRPPPGMPEEHPFVEAWRSLRLRPYGMSVTFTAAGGGPDGYRISTIVQERIGVSDYRREAWDHWSALAFADERLLPRSVYHLWKEGHDFRLHRVQVCDHVGPDEYARYVRAVAERVVETFRELRGRVGLGWGDGVGRYTT